MDWKQPWRLVIDKTDYGTSDSCSAKEEARAGTSPAPGCLSGRGSTERAMCHLNIAVIWPLTMAVLC